MVEAKQPRRPQRRSARSKAQILEGALELFRQKGYDVTTMRDVAERAGMAVGASYYHFRSKEDLVFAYYLEVQEEAEEQAKVLVTKTDSFEERIRGALLFKIEQLARDRQLVQVLARVAADPLSDLSPFTPETAEIRERVLEMFSLLVKGSDVKIGTELNNSLTELMWLHYMGIIFFWAHDRSKDQRRTMQLVDLSMKLVLKLCWLSTLPLTGPVNRLVSELIDTIHGSFAEPKEGETVRK